LKRNGPAWVGDVAWAQEAWASARGGKGEAGGGGGEQGAAIERGVGHATAEPSFVAARHAASVNGARLVGEWRRISASGAL
jgi:hypothetical protein